jgi:hypothetical protein
MIFKSFLSLFLASFICLVHTAGHTANAGVRAPDKRRIAPYMTYPWNLMGRVEFKAKDKKGKLVAVPAANVCTGILVSEDLMLTSATCLLDRPKADGIFVKIPLANIPIQVRATFVSPNPREADFALLKLDRAVAAGYRMIAMGGATRDALMSVPVMAAAYSPDKMGGEYLAFDAECMVTSSSNTTLETDCGVSPIAVGGPLIYFNDDGTAFLLGIKTADRGSASTFISSPVFQRAIHDALAEHLAMTPYR